MWLPWDIFSQTIVLWLVTNLEVLAFLSSRVYLPLSLSPAPLPGCLRAQQTHSFQAKARDDIHQEPDCPRQTCKQQDNLIVPSAT